MKRILFLVLLGLMLSGFSTKAAEAGDRILGIWHTTDDKSQVEIFKEKDKYYAKILSLKEPNWPAGDVEGMAGKPKNDRGNPDPKLRGRPIVGMQFMNGFAYSGKNKWVNGTIYDPESGKTYKCKMTLSDDKHLEVRGFIGISMLGRTVVWTR
ncbi:DUF2147 domain-containing protein [Pedosphaera parvula]|uniref:DUF2147 domain-containing protein n=1 Tax=Pedosphaera parvula (strain Ellin514) TaxID=320771 RepID=B9XSR9_PEDPL|nr:DUF2147 domain-containing protein [Pedosphaera parvula]EEF57121.1 conserved hypothetical protein [Pedosphaera parvula Ellin514]